MLQKGRMHKLKVCATKERICQLEMVLIPIYAIHAKNLYTHRFEGCFNFDWVFPLVITH